MRLYSIIIVILMLFTSCAAIKKKTDFYCYEYGANYKIRFYPDLSWVVYKGVKYTTEEKKALKSDMPIAITMNVNTCENRIINIGFVGESTLAYTGRLADTTKQKILEGLKSNICTEILPIREGEEVKCDSSLVVYIWIK